MKVSVVIPLLNETPILDERLRRLGEALPPEKDWEVVLVDAGSTDGTSEKAGSIASRHGWKFIGANLSHPSIGRTVAAGVARCTGDFAVVCPLDSSLQRDSLETLWQSLESGAAECGGFTKVYEPSPFILRCYAWLQNTFRTRALRHLVWTNGIFFRLPADRAGFIPTMGFLEDVALSDRLRRSEKWVLLSVPIHVSARRYYPNKVLRRISINGLILMLYRAGYSDYPRLFRLYTRLK